MFNSAQITRLLDIANTGTQKGYVLEARQICSAILMQKAEFAPAQINLAFTHIVVDEFDKAREILNEVLEKNEHDNDAKLMLGFSYFVAGEQAEARELLSPLAKDTTLPSGQVAEGLLKQM